MEPPPQYPDDPGPARDNSRPGSRANFATWLIAGIGIALFLAGGGYWLASRPSPAEIEILIRTPEAAGPVVAHIDGAVRTPGVYTLEPGARVEDGISAAGGATDNADLANLNQAALLVDGQRIVIPLLATADVTSGNPTAQVAAPLVDLNTAGLGLLETLPGVGEVKAQAIVDWRNQNGLFTSVDDLSSVPGFGPATVDSLRPLVVQ